MKKLLIILTALAAGLMTSHAVLKEKDLPATLSVLRAELEASYNEQKEYISRYKETTASQHDKMVALMRKSDQISLMLYSQKEDFTFDLAYACHEATELYKEFSKGRVPYDGILDRLDTEIKRYDALITALKNLPPALTDTITTTTPNNTIEATVNNDTIEAAWQRNAQQDSGNAFTLNGNEQEERAQCLRFANVLKNDLAELRESVRTDNEHYLKTAEKLKTLNDYALERYAAIQNNIFVNGDDNYFDVLASFSTHATNARADVNEKYDEERVRAADGTTRTVHSQWRGPIVMGLALFVLFYVVIAALIGAVIIRLVPKRFRTDEFARKRVCLTLAVAITVFGIAVMTARVFLQHNFLLMASRLLMEYAWLLAAILFSLLIRLNGKQIMSGLWVYLPVAVTAFLVITFRIVFIPNNLVQLIFPPNPPRVHALAMVGVQETQQEHTPLRQALHLALRSDNDGRDGSGVGRILPPRRTSADMVDVPVGMHTDSHVRLRPPRDIREQGDGREDHGVKETNTREYCEDNAFTERGEH